MYELPRLGEVIATKPTGTAKSLLLAYLLVVGFTAGLLVNRTPTADRPVAAVGSTPAGTTGPRNVEREAVEPPLWMQLFRPSLPTARVLLRWGLPFLTTVDGSAREVENRNFLVYLAGGTQEQPQTLFQILLPFLRSAAHESPGQGGVSPLPEPTVPAKEPAGQTADSRGSPSPDSTVPTPVDGGQPLVGIFHTHDWESYISEFPTLRVAEPQDLQRIQSERHTERTVMDVGVRLAESLKEQGVTAVYADATHQRLGYNYAYTASRETAKQILRQYPSVRVLVDVHRDGAWGLDTTTVINGRRVAQVRCIIGQNHPGWEQNKAFCDRFVDRLDQMYPGIALPTRVQADRYNQDLIPGAVLLEIGSALNQYEEADRAAAYVGEALAALIREGAYPR